MRQPLILEKILGALFLGMILLGGFMLPLGHLDAAPKADVKSATPMVSVVNINKANLEELQSVRGIGPAIAERILQYRAEHGRFERVEDLTQIRGIGEAKFQKIKNQVSV